MSEAKEDWSKSSHLVVVKWEEKDIKQDFLKTFLDSKHPTQKPIVHTGRKKNTALVEFKEGERKNIPYLKTNWSDSKVWIITEIFGIPPTCTVHVSGLPENVTHKDVYNYFTNTPNTNKLTLDPKVESDNLNSREGWCLIQLASALDVQKICDSYKKFKPFREKTLVIKRYYEQLDDLLNKTIVITSEVEIKNIDSKKYAFLKEYKKDAIENEFQRKACARIYWAANEEKVKLSFSCQHEPVHSIDGRWSKVVQEEFAKKLQKIKVIEKKLSKLVWNETCELLSQYGEFKVIAKEQTLDIIIVGDESEALTDLTTKLDSIKPPPDRITKTREVADVYKLTALTEFGLVRKIEADHDIDIAVDLTKLQMKITGVEENLKKAEKEITNALLSIIVQRYPIRNEKAISILNTAQMKTEIEILMKGYDDCLAKIEKDSLVVVRVGTEYQGHTSIYGNVLGLIKEKKLELEGTVESEAFVKRKMEDVTKIFGSLLQLTWKVSSGKIVVEFECPEEYVDPVSDEIRRSLEGVLVQEEDIVVSRLHIQKLLESKEIEAIERELVAQHIDKKCFTHDKKMHKLSVKGNANVRRLVKEIVKRHVENINVSWVRVEEEGIDVYFDQQENPAALNELQTKYNCLIKIATKREMKKENTHCIALLDSGQAIFASTNDILELKFPVDVIVNAANGDLDHRGGFAKQLSKAGGNRIQKECKAYIHKHGKLESGQVFVSTAGNLNCLRVVHAVGPVWEGGHVNEEQVLAKLTENILKSVVEEPDCFLKSLVLPLLSAGAFFFPKKDAAKVIMETLKKKLADFKSIREVFFCDPNPAVVRVIQDQMEKSFGESCYHVPVENIGVGKGTMTKAPSAKFKIERSGTRTLPLPGNKKIIIVWGAIQTTHAEVVVNTTTTAPKPAGEINNAMHKAAGVIFDLNKQSESAFKKAAQNGQVKDGTVVITKSGNLPCNDTYHIKIAKWNDQTGETDVREYVMNCLKKAVQDQKKSIAFPTIGTHDMNYDEVKVARSTIRTVGEFMKLHTNSALESVKVVIYKQDITCTAAFEEVIENIYSQRPHRLEAVIEETNEKKDGEEEEGAEQVHLAPTDPKPVGSMKKFKVTPQVTLELETGCIEQSDTDVIVCTSSSFPTLNGAIVNAIKKAGGPMIENHCKNNVKKYPDVGIASAPGGRLKCKKVYILKLDDYKKQDDGKKIYGFVKACLEKAEVERYGSITFPTIGTGGFRFPDVTSAANTFQAIVDFFKRQNTCLSYIQLVMYPQAKMSIQTFTAEADNYFKRTGPQPPVQVVQLKDDAGPKVQQAAEKWSVPNTLTKVEISFGNLEKTQADVILNTTTSFPSLNGAIPTALTRVAGSGLQKECTNYPNKVSEGDIVETGGYNLPCKKVFHFVLPQWDRSGRQKMINDKVQDCLHLMKRSDLHSIAMPSIGTGGYSYDPRMVANGLYAAVKTFAESCPKYACVVNVVLYPPAKEVNKVFTEVLGQMRSGQQPKKGVRFALAGPDEEDEEETRDIKPRKMKDFVLFQIISDNPRKEKDAFMDIKRKIEDDKKQIQIDLKTEKTFDDTKILTEQNNKKMILDIGEGYMTKVEIDLTKKKIHLKGMGDNVRKCHEKILDQLRELRSNEGQKKIGNVVYKFLEWCYTEDGGRIWVPYPRKIAYMLEDAFKQNEPTKEFKDSDDKKYEVNFGNMTENEKGAKDRTRVVNVVRKDFSIGDIDALPGHWDPMGTVENLKEVVLQATDQEYLDVQAKFKSTLGGFLLNQIVQIKRIQNQALYQQYATKKKQLETDLKGVVQNVEQILWHGIKEDTEAFITSNGFNRGYAGQTFAGHLWYGQGTYFAKNSSYSAGDNYSPAGIDGCKRMYMVKVLTGQTIDVPQGYSERFPPLLPNSQTDRYNSVCDDINNPQEFVIFSDTQAYPEYLIYFK